MNIPNTLTVIRFIIIPIFGFFLFKESYTLAVILFLLGGLTDVLDGYIARKFNLVTSWGKLADPVADKLMQITALTILTFVIKRIPIPIVLIVVAKEVFMGIGSISLYKKEHHVVSANWYGKLATVVFYLAIMVIIVFNLKEPYSGIFVGIALLPTIFAFIMYVTTFSKIRRESRS
ncbi:MAG: CDP-alcohol phosphatidyltransferase family protein [Bacillota bacterium]|nr:CDP-alcohol phosphatidyltransferase family protein [Bacillota bacterium]